MNYTITKNENYGSYEITFDGKPSESVRDLMKSHGYRWHGVRRVWYGYTDISEEIKAVASGEKVPAQAVSNTEKELASDKEEQKRLLDEYIKLLSDTVYKNDRGGMLEYIRKETARIFKTENGYYIAIDKPRIETHFCFGYGYCGITTEEDAERARNVERYARTDEIYFIEQNTKELRRIIDGLKDKQNEIVTYTKYSAKAGADFCIKGFYIIKNYCDRERAELMTRCEPLSDSDRNRLVSAHEKVLQDFEKRLKTYLKKYGLSRLHTWTYLSD